MVIIRSYYKKKRLGQQSFTKQGQPWKNLNSSDSDKKQAPLVSMDDIHKTDFLPLSVSIIECVEMHRECKPEI